MSRFRLLRSTPFRLALTFVVLFVGAFVLASVTGYRLLSHELKDRLDETVHNTFTVIAATYADGDIEDLIAAVDSHARLTPEGEQVYLLVGPDGKKLSGDFSASGIPAGFSTKTGTEIGVADRSDYRIFSGNVGANVLTVAANASDTEELEGVFLTTFGWATVIVSLLAIAGGATLAAGVQRRLDNIASTMADVAMGNLAARIPLRGSRDDIDTVSSQINAAIERLAGLVEGMKQVSADIAHDLKTPLGRLQIILDTAYDSAVAGRDVSADLIEARAESMRINGTFEALLRIAQIEGGARKASFATVSLADVVKDIAEAYTDVVLDAGMSLVVMGTERADTIVRGDRQLLLQLCANLIENTLTHCPTGTRISLSIDRQEQSAALIISDTGPGIPAHERTNVLRRLYRLDKSRTTDGSGLGLSLVKAIADLHGADLVLEDNRPGLRISVAFSTMDR